MMTFWYVVATCVGLAGDCTFHPREPLPSREACYAYGRKLQLERGLPMNAFRCVKML